MLVFIVLGVLCLAGAAFLLGEATTAPARERRVSVRRASTYGKIRPAEGPQQLPFSQRVLAPLGDRLASWTLKLRPKTTTDGVRERLLAAGLGRSISPTTFLAVKSALALGGLFLGGVLGGAMMGAGGVLFGEVIQPDGLHLVLSILVDHADHVRHPNLIPSAAPISAAARSARRAARPGHPRRARRSP